VESVGKSEESVEDSPPRDAVLVCGVCAFILVLWLRANPALFRLKDNDVTWLYGPLQAGGDTNTTINTGQHFGTSSSTEMKPILKKRSITEDILKGSYTGAVTPPGDNSRRGMITRTASGCSRVRDRGGVPSSAAYGLSHPRWKRKCVHFSGKVEKIRKRAEGGGTP
jgi:hypothetical protein